MTCAGNPIVILVEDASQGRAHSQHLEIISGYQLTVRSFRLTLAGDAQRNRKARQQPGENVVIIPHLFVKRIRERRSAISIAPYTSLLGSGRAQDNQFLRVFDRQKP